MQLRTSEQARQTESCGCCRCCAYGAAACQIMLHMHNGPAHCCCGNATQHAITALQVQQLQSEHATIYMQLSMADLECLLLTGEVKRVLHILRDTERQAAAQPGPSAPKPPVAEAAPPDAYAVLGVTPSTPTADVRKRYWKLSLLVHPDKCNAEGAQEAFQAVAKAAATLQDAAARQQLDQKR